MAGVMASICFALGKAPRSCALGIWLLHSWLYTANPLTANPSLGYVGLLLLLCALISNKHGHVPRMIMVTAWVLLALGYSFSGLLKLGSPSWIDGTAMDHLMHNPLSRPGIARDIMLWLPARPAHATQNHILFLDSDCLFCQLDSNHPQHGLTACARFLSPPRRNGTDAPSRI